MATFEKAILKDRSSPQAEVFVVDISGDEEISI